MKKTAEVAIIGGGILGICTAYFLAQKGQKDIVVYEKDFLAQASTGLSVGGIRQQFTLPSNILLSRETVRLFETFKERFEKDINFRQVGYLFLAREEETWKDLVAGTEIQKHFKVPVTVLSPDEIKKRWPYIKVDDLKGGTFCEEDGYADPYLVTMAFAEKARKLGVRIEEKTKITGIKIQNNQIEAIETSKGMVHTSKLVNTAGPWGGEIFKMAGIDIPVQPFRRQVFMTKAFDSIPKPVPMIIDTDVHFYIRGEHPGLIMGMSDMEEPSSFNTHVDWDFLEQVIEVAVHRVPVLEKAQILRGWAGLYSVTPDNNPVIGTIPEIKGLYFATGFSGHGFQHAPPTGRILSELIVKGSSSFDLKPFSWDRYKKKKQSEERRVV